MEPPLYALTLPSEITSKIACYLMNVRDLLSLRLVSKSWLDGTRETRQVMVPSASEGPSVVSANLPSLFPRLRKVHGFVTHRVGPSDDWWVSFREVCMENSGPLFLRVRCTWPQTPHLPLDEVCNLIVSRYRRFPNMCTMVEIEHEDPENFSQRSRLYVQGGVVRNPRYLVMDPSFVSVEEQDLTVAHKHDEALANLVRVVPLASLSFDPLGLPLDVPQYFPVSITMISGRIHSTTSRSRYYVGGSLTLYYHGRREDPYRHLLGPRIHRLVVLPKIGASSLQAPFTYLQREFSYHHLQPSWINRMVIEGLQVPLHKSHKLQTFCNIANISEIELVLPRAKLSDSKNHNYPNIRVPISSLRPTEHDLVTNTYLPPPVTCSYCWVPKDESLRPL